MTILFTIKDINLNEGDKLFLSQNSLIKTDDVETYLQDSTRFSNVANLIRLLDNIPTFIFSCSEAFRQSEMKPTEYFQTINSLDYTGYTFVNLLESEIFTTHYYTVKAADESIYFKQQFEEYIFAGDNLFARLSKTHLIPSLLMLEDGSYDKNKFQALFKLVTEEVGV